jgi:hypothetical protein
LLKNQNRNKSTPSFVQKDIDALKFSSLNIYILSFGMPSHKNIFDIYSIFFGVFGNIYLQMT